MDSDDLRMEGRDRVGLRRRIAKARANTAQEERTEAEASKADMAPLEAAELQGLRRINLQSSPENTHTP